MSIKALLYTSVTISLLANPAYIFAQTGSATRSGMPALRDERKDLIVTRCDEAIKLRLTTLNGLSTRLNSFKRLNDSQKNVFQNQISSAISGLNSVKTKCDSDTEVADIRAANKSVYTTYRIYAVQAPQIHLLAAADSLSVAADDFSTLITALTSRIATLGNPANLTALLSDMKSKVEDAKTQSNLIISSLSGLTPESFNTNPSSVRTAFTTARTALQTGITDIKAAWTDAKQIRSAIKLIKTTPTPTI